MTEQKNYGWDEWLYTKGQIFLELPIPTSALIDETHFVCFIEDYTDILPEHNELMEYGINELNELSDKEAIKTLIALESYVTRPLMCWMLLELRKRFNLPCEFEDDGETWPSIPQNIIDKYLYQIRIEGHR